MMPHVIRHVFVCTLFLASMLLAGRPVAADESSLGCNEDAMLVFDASGSMASMGYNGLAIPRIFEARDALREILPQVSPFRRLGLVVYGPGPRNACSNVHLRLQPVPHAADRILAEIEALQPEGDTPLTEAVGKAAEALSHRDRPGIIVLVTDGRETCGGAPCVLAEQIVRDSADLTVHVIGFRVRGESFDPTSFGDGGFEKGGYTQARCLADQTGGLYLSAESTEELVDALQQTLGCALLSDAAGHRQILADGENMKTHFVSMADSLAPVFGP